MSAIGIITVLYRSQNVIDGFIASLNAQDHKDFEVYFVQNDDQDTYSEVRIQETAEFKWIYVQNDANVGVATGNNQGIDYFLTRGDIKYVHFLNNDIEVDPSFLSAQIQLFNDRREIDALAPKMFYYGTNGKIWYAGGCLSYLKGGPRHYGHHKKDSLVGKDLYLVDYAPTCSVLLKKSVLASTGIRMWDELFVYHDDYVFCKELKKNGVKLWYAPNIHLQHKVSAATGGKKSDFSRYYLTRNWLYVILKSKSALLVIIPFVWVYYYISKSKIECLAIKDAFGMACSKTNSNTLNKT